MYVSRSLFAHKLLQGHFIKKKISWILSQSKKQYTKRKKKSVGQIFFLSSLGLRVYFRSHTCLTWRPDFEANEFFSSMEARTGCPGPRNRTPRSGGKNHGEKFSITLTEFHIENAFTSLSKPVDGDVLIIVNIWFQPA